MEREQGIGPAIRMPLRTTHGVLKSYRESLVVPTPALSQQLEISMV
jgi:hypothetical protein